MTTFDTPRAKATFLAFALLAGASSAARATTYLITSLLDGVAVDGECRLREAIRAAESNQPSNECPAGEPVDEIVLQTSGNYAFALGEELLFSGSGALKIRGGTKVAEAHQIDLGNANRFLNLNSGSFIALEDLTLKRGFAAGNGGALWFQAGAFALHNVTVRDSQASNRGGGLFASLTGDDGIVAVSSLDRSRFVDNRASGTAAGQQLSGGGAVVLLNGLATIAIRETRFEGNVVEGSGLGAVATGGGLELRVHGATSEATLAFVEFVDNAASAAGAWGAGAALAARSGARLIVEDVSFAGNGSAHALPSERGLILDVDLSSLGTQSLRLRRFTLVANDGGATTDPELSILAEGGSDIVLDSGIVAAAAHAGIRLVAADEAEVRMGQLTVAENDGAGLTISTSSTIFQPRLENSILWGNGVPGGTSADLVATGDVDADRFTNHNWIGDQGDPDPLFVDPLNGDYSLQAASGGVDAGDALFATVGPYDANHAPRVVDGDIDLGALERGGLFADGFESASLAAWSAVVP